MFRNIRRQIASLLSIATLVVVPLAAPVLVSADQITDNLCQGATLKVDSGANCNGTSAGTDKINSIITNVINVFSIVVGVVAVIMIIVGGFRYITSGGDSNNVSGAKNTIIYAIIGLVVVALAQFIVQFVLNRINQ